MSWVFVGDDKFYLHDNETLLAGLQRVGFSPAFECCQGYCGTCKVKMTQLQGNTAHTLPPLCMLDDDEILACCCKVNGTIWLSEMGARQLALFD